VNGKKIKAIQKENEIRKAVSRTLRWRLRIKLQKDNTDKQPTVPEKNTYNSNVYSCGLRTLHIFLIQKEQYLTLKTFN
jgi:hypothetical protein